MNRLSDDRIHFVKILCTVLAALLTMAACVMPMADLPLWNGEIPGHRNQYELMAEAILDGRIDFAYGDEAELEKLQNPYDPKERDEAGVRYHWDHAYYNGHYYMYFGIVPVFLAFLPYRIITGNALTTFHATQLFAALTIAGIFVLFDALRKRFFRELPFSVYLGLSAAFGVMSVWYSAAEPALYCTAITAALALEVWSIYFFVRGVYLEKKENRQILFAGIGALLGALAFGCRPPIALANIVVIPLLWVFLQKRKFTWKLLLKLALAAAPYAVVGVCLMIYNYVRFDNPFEFGQAYQLTVADQSDYRVTLDAEQLLRIVNGTCSNFFQFQNVSGTFPYVQANGVFFNFPVLVLSLAGIVSPVRAKAKEKKIYPFMMGLFISALVITAADVLWSPYLLERYRMDIYFLMGIGCFIAMGLWHHVSGESQKKGLSIFYGLCAAVTLLQSFLLFVRTVGVYYPDKVTQIAAMLGLA